MAILGQKPRGPKTDPGGKGLSRGHMPRLVHLFPLLTKVPVLRPSWRNSTPTHVLPPPDPLLLLEVAHAPWWPTTAASDASRDAWLTLSSDLIHVFSTLLPISYRIALWSRSFAPVYLRTSPFITYFGL